MLTLLSRTAFSSPTSEVVDFIKWLIAQGSDVNFPADKKPLQYAIKCEEEISRRKGKACDMSEILLLLRESGADSTGLDELIDGGFSARVKL